MASVVPIIHVLITLLLSIIYCGSDSGTNSCTASHSD